MRDVSGERVDDGDRLLAAAHAHVHVDTEYLHLSRRPLHLVDQALIAWVRADLLRRRVAERMRPRAHEHESVAVGVLTELRQRGREVGVRLAHGAADADDDLDGRLQQLGFGLGMDAVGVADLHLRENLVRAADQLARVAVDQLELHLHADRGPRAGRELDGHGYAATARWSCAHIWSSPRKCAMNCSCSCAGNVLRTVSTTSLSNSSLSAHSTDTSSTCDRWRAQKSSYRSTSSWRSASSRYCRSFSAYVRSSRSAMSKYRCVSMSTV